MSSLDPLNIGNDVSDLHRITGSLLISGSLIVNIDGSNEVIVMGDDPSDPIVINGRLSHTGSYVIYGPIRYAPDYTESLESRSLVDKQFVVDLVNSVKKVDFSVTSSYTDVANYSYTSGVADNVSTIDIQSNIRFFKRCWYLLSNPFLYLFTGKIRW